MPAYYSLKTRLLNNKFEDIDRLDENWVYKINRGDSNHAYIGLTRRSFKIRSKEHLDSKSPSHVADHMLDYDHHTNISNIELLNFANNGELDILESYEIKKNSLVSPLINQQVNFLDTPLFNIPLTPQRSHRLADVQLHRITTIINIYIFFIIIIFF